PDALPIWLVVPRLGRLIVPRLARLDLLGILRPGGLGLDPAATGAEGDHQEHQADHRDRGPAGIGERYPFVLVVDGPGDGDRLRSWCGAVRDDQQRAIGLLVLTALPCVEVGDV